MLTFPQAPRCSIVRRRFKCLTLRVSIATVNKTRAIAPQLVDITWTEAEVCAAASPGSNLAISCMQHCRCFTNMRSYMTQRRREKNVIMLIGFDLHFPACTKFNFFLKGMKMAPNDSDRSSTIFRSLTVQ